MPDEQSSTLVVEGLLSLKKGPDTALLELENDARDALLGKVSGNRNEKNSLICLLKKFRRKTKSGIICLSGVTFPFAREEV